MTRWASHPNASNVAFCAVMSRLTMWAMCFVSSSIVPDFDSSSRLLTRSTPADVFVDKVFGMFGHWDGVFFLEIAEHGYHWDKFYAFFPGYPLLLRIVADSVLAPLSSILAYRSTLVVAGFLVSHASFVVAAVMLYKLGCIVIKDATHAYYAALLFCVNPASIFCSAFYTESLFCALTFGGLVCLASERERGILFTVLGGVLFVGAASTRSNGITYCLYLAHSGLFRVHGMLRTGSTAQWGLVAVQVVLCFAMIAPYLFHLRSAYLSFCVPLDESSPVWCSGSVPNIYSHCQKAYWGLGLWKYYQLKQLPNFVLAGPVLGLSVKASWLYGAADPVRFFSGGLKTSDPTRTGGGFTGPAVGVYIYHWIAVLVLAAPVIHIQVLTRLLVATPPLYWYAAQLVMHKGWGRYMVLGFFLGYFVLGALLFPNFLPWT